MLTRTQILENIFDNKILSSDNSIYPRCTVRFTYNLLYKVVYCHVYKYRVQSTMKFMQKKK